MSPTSAAGSPARWSRTANSSPPGRATTASAGARRRSRQAAARNSPSPAGCPSGSLTSSKQSRSTSSNASGRPESAAAAHRPLEPLAEQVAVGQTCHGVVVGEVADPGIARPPLAEVARDRREAGERSVRRLDPVDPQLDRHRSATRPELELGGESSPFPDRTDETAPRAPVADRPQETDRPKRGGSAKAEQALGRRVQIGRGAARLEDGDRFPHAFDRHADAGEGQVGGAGRVAPRPLRLLHRAPRVLHRPR